MIITIHVHQLMSLSTWPPGTVQVVKITHLAALQPDLGQSDCTRKCHFADLCRKNLWPNGTFHLAVTIFDQLWAETL